MTKNANLKELYHSLNSRTKKEFLDVLLIFYGLKKKRFYYLLQTAEKRVINNSSIRIITIQLEIFLAGDKKTNYEY